MLTNLSHASVSGSFSLVASRSHDLKCSAFITDGPPARPVRSFRTSSAIYYPYVGISTILPGCTRIGSGYRSSGRRLYRYYCRVETPSGRINVDRLSNKYRVPVYFSIGKHILTNITNITSIFYQFFTQYILVTRISVIKKYFEYNAPRKNNKTAIIYL